MFWEGSASEPPQKYPKLKTKTTYAYVRLYITCRQASLLSNYAEGVVLWPTDGMPNGSPGCGELAVRSVTDRHYTVYRRCAESTCRNAGNANDRRSPAEQAHIQIDPRNTQEWGRTVLHTK